MPTPDFSTITPSPTYKTVNFLEIKKKILHSKEHGQLIIFASGVFDGLHSEHLNFLKLSKQLGGFLVVALESDARTKALKGPTRPIHSESERLHQILANPFVDAAFILPEDFSSPTRFEEVIWQIQPDIMAVSSHSQHIPYKTSIMKKYGGSLQIVHQHNPEVSTTKILQQSKSESNKVTRVDFSIQTSS